jgi:hypothetical protein
MTKDVHHQTRKAADMAIARKQISPDSHRAVLAGEISLQDARELGRSGTPQSTAQGTTIQEEATETSGTPQEQPTDAPLGTRRSCLCGCGETTRGGRFRPGHDARLHAELKRNLEKDPLLRNERFDDEQRRYAVERGLAGPEVLPEEERDG